MEKNKTLNQRKNTFANVYYMLSVAFFACAIVFFSTEESKATGFMYISLGCVWIGLGSILKKRAKAENETLKYYNDNAQAFVEGTIGADMSDARNKFLSHMTKPGLILDWGCGSGRDSLAFIEAGFSVEAADASEELCRLASEKLGQEVRCESFDELNAKEKYDGIWACASLLHLDKNVIPTTFEIACKALKPGGVMYASFKYGEFEGERGGRYFVDMTEERFAKVIKYIKKFELVDQWTTDDVREDRNDKWLNVILRKKENKKTQ